MEDPNELPDDLKQLLEKYEYLAMNLCYGGSAMSYIALGKLLKVGHINKDLDLIGMEIFTNGTSFLQCVQQAVKNSRNACTAAHNWFHDNRANNLIKYVEDHLKNKDIKPLKQRCNKYKDWACEIESNLTQLEAAQMSVAEIYARYITTRGTFKTQVIEELAAVRKELKQLEATQLYIRSLLAVVNAQLDQFCAMDLHITVELLVKFYIHAAFINELRKTGIALLSFDLSEDLYNLMGRKQTFDENYLKYESKCIDSGEKIKEIINERKKKLQVQICDGICVWKNYNCI